MGLGVAMMRDDCGACAFREAHEIQVLNLKDDLIELKQRVGHLETTLARAVMLLVANLVAVSLSLAQQLAQS